MSKGFSLVESVVAALVFAAAVVGVFSTAATLKRPAVGTDKRLAAAFYAKQILEDLRAKVDQRDWDTVGGPLSLNAGNAPQTFTLPVITNPTYGVPYSISYTVSTIPGNTARQVDVTVSWPD